MKKKSKEYQPLHWCKFLTGWARSLFNNPEITSEELRDISKYITLRTCGLFKYKESRKLPAVFTRYSKQIRFLNKNLNHHIVNNAGETEALKDNYYDVDCMSLALGWENNKQVYRFDKDFLSELLRSENLMITKDVFCYLPYKYFYIDISDNPEICSKIGCTGLFVSVDKDTSEDGMEFWFIRMCKIKDDMFFYDFFILPNCEGVLHVSEFKENIELSTYKGSENNVADVTIGTAKIDGETYKALVIQVLLYLSSAEPDIREGEMTRETYRKPADGVKPKNKFSEIQSWDVGVRFGNTYRKWEKEVNAEASKEHSSSSSKTGIRKRPHTRRGHYHTYWYGKRDGSEERVKRAIWIEPVFIGIKGSDDEMPAVIHKVV